MNIPSLKVFPWNHLFLQWLVATDILTCLRHPHCEYSMDEETGLARILSPVRSRLSCNKIGEKKSGKLDNEIWRNYFSRNFYRLFQKTECINGSGMLKDSVVVNKYSDTFD